MNMNDIFICYSRADIAIATVLVKQLEAEGWSVFLDKQTPIGRRWHQEIEKQLHAARAVVVLWSAHSRDSDYVLEEAEYGKRKEILFPAFVEPVEFPYGFSRIQTVNLVGWHGSPTHPEWMALLQSLRLHLHGHEQILVTPEPVEPIQPPVTPAIPIQKPDDSASGGSQPGSKEPTIRKFLLLVARVLLDIIRKFLLPVARVVLLGIIIFFGMVVFFYRDNIQPSPVSAPDLETASVEATEEKAVPIKQAVKTSQNQSNTLLDRARLPELVRIPAGSFRMGEQDEAFIKTLSEDMKRWHGVPGKHISISTPFYLGKTEVTYDQYDYYVQLQQTNGIEVESPQTATGGRGNQPVVNIDWRQAMAYVQWLGKQTNNQCRLPTEAEWEYAACARTNTAYPWGDEVGSNHANCDGCGSPWDNKQSAPVGSFTANKFGLYDMSGNVWEWTCSNWREQFNGQEQQCTNQESTGNRVLRGGSWDYFPDFVRSSSRLNYRPDYRGDDIGFRVLCSSLINEWLVADGGWRFTYPPYESETLPHQTRRLAPKKIKRRCAAHSEQCASDRLFIDGGRAQHPETDTAVTRIRMEAVAGGRAHAARTIEPGATAQHAQ